MPSSTRAVIGTAGHVDHGKTTLVRELTGIDTDRLPEEKARGISIELGFAWIDAEAGRVAFVDVPGHERFVRQMIAGAAGIDAVLLVVAADEGVMPQTREHLDICALLGIELGAVVLTKVDLVDPDWLALARDDVAAAVRGTFLEGAPIVGFSAGDAAARREVRMVIDDLVAASERRRAASLAARRDRPFALPVDRAFSTPGFGTIVTGTTQAGELAIGDPVVFFPGGTEARVRGLEAHGARLEVIGPGVRAAVNAPGLDRAATARTGVLVSPDGPRPTSMIDATFAPIARLPEPVADGEKGLVHIGTQRVEATLCLLDGPGARPPLAAQLRLAEPIAFLPGAAYVFRGFRTWAGRPDLGLTLGGGRALAPSAQRHRRRPDHAARVSALTRAPEVGAVAWIAAHGEVGAPRPHLAASLPWSRVAIEAAVTSGVASGALLATPTTVVARASLGHLERAIVDALATHHRERPTRPGMRGDELRTRVRPEAAADLFERVVATLVSERKLLRPAPELFALPGFVPKAVADEALLDAIVARLEVAELSPPSLPELASSLAGSPPARLVEEAVAGLVTNRRLTRVADLVFATSILEAFVVRVRAWFTEHEWLDAQHLKELSGASRKFAIPLGEWLDRARVTVRVGDRRRLRA